jgi:hypothetical protein
MGPAGQLNYCYPGRYDECFILGLPDHSISSYNLITNNCTKSSLPHPVMNDLNWSSKLYFLSDSLNCDHRTANRFLPFTLRPGPLKRSFVRKKIIFHRWLVMLFFVTKNSGFGLEQMMDYSGRISATVFFRG